MATIMGIDQSKNGFGWAVRSTDWRSPRWGHARFEKQGNDEAPMFDEAYQLVKNLIRQYGVEQIYIEGFFVPIFKKGGRAPTINIHSEFPKLGIVTCIMLAQIHSGLPAIEAVDIQKWRGWFLPIKRAPAGYDWKEAAIRECRNRGWEVKMHDEAEACGIADYGLSLHSVEHRRQSLPLFNGRPGRVMA